MNNITKFCCKELVKRVQDDETAIDYYNEFREFGIKVLDGGTAHIKIDYCPWCGTELPSKLRHRWFEELEKLGIDEPSEQEYPEEFNTEEWWQKRNL